MAYFLLKSLSDDLFTRNRLGKFCMHAQDKAVLCASNSEKL